MVLLKISGYSLTGILILKTGTLKSEVLKFGTLATENCSEKDLLEYAYFTSVVTIFEKYDM